MSKPALTTKSRLAELVARDITIADAAERIGITKGRAYAIWAGDQAGTRPASRMSPDQRRAAQWAAKLLDGFFALTGTEPKPESRGHFETLRAMARGK